jgi:hypothetical protein
MPLLLSNYMKDFPPIEITVRQWPCHGTVMISNIAQLLWIHNCNYVFKVVNLLKTRAWSQLRSIVAEDETSLLYEILSVPELEAAIHKFVYFHSFKEYTPRQDGSVTILRDKPNGVFVSSPLFSDYVSPLNGFHARDMNYYLPCAIFQSFEVTTLPYPAGYPLDDPSLYNPPPSNILSYALEGALPSLCFEINHGGVGV